MAKRTLYQTLHVSASADAEVIKAAYEARLAALKSSAAPEVAAERTLLREAYELLSDPVRRKLYDERLREERLRALSSGGEPDRPRPANAYLPPAEEPRSSPLGWMAGVALIAVAVIVGSWVWLDHKRQLEAQRLASERQAAEVRRQEEQAKLQRESVDWAKDRTDNARAAAEERRQEAQRVADNRRLEYERERQARAEAQEARRKDMERRRAEIDAQRADQENMRRAQMQLERDRRYLQELERNRGMQIPSR